MTVIEDTTQTHAFTETDFERIIAAHQEIERFKSFVLDRFKTFALAHEDGMDVDAIIQRGGGYTSFVVAEHSLFDPGFQEIVINQRTAMDRGGDYHTKAYKLPKVFLFKTTEEEKEFAQFIALRAKLFPKG